VIAAPEALAAKLIEWQQKGYHVLSPAIQVWAFAPGYGVNVSIVQLDPAVDDRGLGRDTYFDRTTMKAPDGRDGDPDVMAPTAERAIAAIGLRRIAQCAGVAWHPELTGRTDDRRIQHYWEFRAVGLVQTYDGTWLSLQATKEVDLRDGSAQIGGWTPERWAELMERNRTAKADERKWSINGWSEKRVLQARGAGLRNAESKAMNAAIRMIGLKHKYSVAELNKPFIVLRANYIPDLADPRIRQLVAERAMSGTAALFAPHQPMRILPAPVEPLMLDAPATVEHVFVAPAGPSAPAQAPSQPPAPASASPAPAATGSHAPAVAPAPPAARQATPPSHAPATLPPGARFVQSTKIAKTGTNDNGAWTKFDIVFSDGLAVSTFSETDAGVAAEAQSKGVPVTIKTSSAGKYGTKLESIAFVDLDQPALFGDPSPDDAPAAARPANATPPDLTAAELGF
jgi:hypothetical protein